jgi:hypothetical protein
LYVGGAFYAAGNVAATNIAKWDGEKWSSLDGGVWRNPNPASEGAVHDLALFKGELIVAGEFHFAGGIAATNLARWDGTQWHAFAGGDANSLRVNALAVDRENLYVAGNFQSIGGIAAGKIARWDGTNWFPLGSGINYGGPTTLAIRQGQLFVGGQFTMVGNKPATNIALWHIPRTLRIERGDGQATLSWPKPDSDLMLEMTEDPASGRWQTVTAKPALEQNRWTVMEPLSGDRKFYRLREKP